MSEEQNNGAADVLREAIRKERIAQVDLTAAIVGMKGQPVTFNYSTTHRNMRGIVAGWSKRRLLVKCEDRVARWCRLESVV